jgi:hypothetical protein
MLQDTVLPALVLHIFPPSSQLLLLPLAVASSPLLSSLLLLALEVNPLQVFPLALLLQVGVVVALLRAFPLALLLLLSSQALSLLPQAPLASSLLLFSLLQVGVGVVGVVLLLLLSSPPLWPLAPVVRSERQKKQHHNIISSSFFSSDSAFGSCC